MDAIQTLHTLKPFVPEFERRGYRPQVLQDGTLGLTIDNASVRLSGADEAIHVIDASSESLAWIVEFIDEHPEWESEQFEPGTAEAVWLANARRLVSAGRAREHTAPPAVPKTVIESVNRKLWVDFLSPEVCDLEADSVVGFGVVGLLNRVEKLLEFDGANHDCYFEPKVREAFIDMALHQVRVWYYG